MLTNEAVSFQELLAPVRKALESAARAIKDLGMPPCVLDRVRNAVAAVEFDLTRKSNELALNERQAVEAAEQNQLKKRENAILDALANAVRARWREEGAPERHATMYDRDIGVREFAALLAPRLCQAATQAALPPLNEEMLVLALEHIGNVWGLRSLEIVHGLSETEEHRFSRGYVQPGVCLRASEIAQRAQAEDPSVRCVAIAPALDRLVREIEGRPPVAPQD